MDKPGFYRGRHFTTYVEDVRRLKRSDQLDEAIELLGHLVDATEAEARKHRWGVAPWYYEQLAIVHAKRGEKAAEVATLERYEAQPQALGLGPSKLGERLTRLKSRAQLSKQ